MRKRETLIVLIRYGISSANRILPGILLKYFLRENIEDTEIKNLMEKWKKQSERSFRNLTNINLYIDVDFYIPWKYVKLSTLLFLLITAYIVYGK